MVAKPLASLTQKIRKYEWAKEQEEAFQMLKDNLCDAPILSLPDGSKEFVVYCDASNQGLGCVLMKRGKVENATAEMLRGLNQLIKRKVHGGMKFIWVPLIDDVRTLIMDEAHASSLVHPGTDKTYYDVRDIMGGHVFDVLYLKRCMEGSVGHMFFGLKLEKFGRLDQNWYKRQQIRVEVGDKVMLEVSSWKDECILERKKLAQEANIAWDDIQAKVEADYQLAQRLQAQEQEELSDAEKATLFVQLLEKRRKHFAAKRAEEKRNRPPTKAQQRSFMCTYLKNMEGWKPKDLKNKSFANIQDLFDKAMKRVNTFVDMDTELVKESSKKAEAEIAQESSSKRAGEALEQESSKKQKVDDDKETEELKQCMEIISDDGDDVTIEATPLSTKSPTIVDYKIYKEGKKSYFQIIRADDNSQMYLTFGKMLKNFDREDLEVIWSIVKARFKKIEPVNYMDIFLHLNLKTMFEHHLEDNVWKNQQGLVKVLNWKLYDSCGVHCVTMHNIFYYLLVEKMYPLTKHTLHQMFNDVKLQVDYECQMAFELLRLIKKQLKEGYGRIVRIKSLLEVTAVKLVLLVQKLLQLVLKVNVAGIKVTTAERLQLLKG
ncbi:putative ribonuclease H-like domain-containing protein [Tanacetum coccineum]